MYNSSIKGQAKRIKFDKKLELKDKVFFNDLSKNIPIKAFKCCDVVYSEISWSYGYRMFNQQAVNKANDYSNYLHNVNACIEELQVPSFIVCGKQARNFFTNAKCIPIKINSAGTNINGCQLYIWNFDDDILKSIVDTKTLLNFLSKKYSCCLDFSCGYGEHLLQFKDFVACDIGRDCLTYLTILVQQQERSVKNAPSTN